MFIEWWGFTVGGKGYGLYGTLYLRIFCHLFSKCFCHATLDCTLFPKLMGVFDVGPESTVSADFNLSSMF